MPINKKKKKISFERVRPDSRENKAVGFQRTKPLPAQYEHSAPAGAIKTKTASYKDMVKRNGPYDLFITLTVGRTMSDKKLISYANKLINRMNKKLFSRKYYEKDNAIEGFAFIEDHNSPFSANDLHVHMLVKHNDRYSKFDISDLKGIFYAAADSILNMKGRKVFNRKAIDIQEVKDDGIIDYCFKQIYDKKLDRIKIITTEGISDDLGFPH